MTYRAEIAVPSNTVTSIPASALMTLLVGGRVKFITPANFMAPYLAAGAVLVTATGAATLVGVLTGAVVGTAIPGVAATMTPADATGYAVLYSGGAEQGARQAFKAPATVALTPAAAVSTTVRIYSALTGGVVLLESSAFAVGAKPVVTTLPLGVYVGAPNGSDATAEAGFISRRNDFVTAMGGRVPAFMGAFTDYAAPPVTWPANANWTAWSWKQSAAALAGTMPVVGVPLSDIAHLDGGSAGRSSNDFFLEVIGGTYDEAYAGIASNWAGQGYKTVRYSLGFEMNVAARPWFFGRSKAVQANWVAAFQHVATVMRNAAALAGGTALIAWTPGCTPFSDLAAEDAYPGDAYVDIVSVNSFSTLAPRDLYDWAKDDGTTLYATVAAWMLDPINRRHFWSQPSATQIDKAGQYWSGYSIRQAIALCVLHGKPLGVSQCGMGAATADLGLHDDPEFPKWLAGELYGARAQGVALDHVIIYDIDLPSGSWAFLAGSTKPLTAAAWAASWGAAAVAPTAAAARVESAQAASVASTAGTIVDSKLALWTLRTSQASGYQAARNGTIDKTTSALTQLLYWGHAVWRTSPNASTVSTPGWWYWNEATWVAAANPQGSVAVPTESAQGTALTTTTGSIIDANLDTFALAASTASGLQATKNGVLAGSTGQISKMLYWAHKVYHTSPNASPLSTPGWWYWDGATWVATAADPSLTVVTPPTTLSRVPAPLTGSVAVGTWVARDITVAGVTLPSGKQVHFNYLPPAQLNASYTYPLQIWLHGDGYANAWYLGTNTDPLYIGTSDGNTFYNTVNLRTAYPSFVVCGYADQTFGTGAANSAVNNWGGWLNNGSVGSGTVFSGDTGPNVFAILGVVQYMLANFPIDPNRVYVNGMSLGGIGAEYLMLKYNQVNGLPKLFTAGLSNGGVMEINGGTGPTAADVTTMANVPVWWVSGGQDTTSKPGDWNEPMWRLQAGNANYPAPNSSAAASKAGTSAYHYWEDPAIGHSVTDAAGNPYPTNPTLLTWLFSQINGTVVTTPVFTESAEATNVTAVGPTITDAAGNVYSISAGAQVVTNGAVETKTSGVLRMYYHLRQLYVAQAGPVWYTRTGPPLDFAVTTDPTPVVVTPPTTTTFAASGNGGLLLGPGYVATSGSQFIDRNSGTPVRLCCVNWSGGEGPAGSNPHGMYYMTYQAILDGIKSYGFNCIRLPYSDVMYQNQSMFVPPPGDGRLNANTNLLGKPYMAFIDLVVAYCGTIGLKIIFDHHDNEGNGGQQLNGLWYDLGSGTDGTDGKVTGTITYDIFKANLVAIAKRYAGNATVIGFDLDNEPTYQYSGGHGLGPYWDSTTNTYNMHFMAQDTGNAILAVNPDVLIIVECPLVTDAGRNFYGGDCTLAGNLPVVLNIANRLVYSVHIYPNSIGGQPAAQNAGTGAITMYNAMFGFLVKNNTAPVWIGETGYGNKLAGEDTWLATWSDYILGNANGGPTFTGTQQPLSLAYWELGPGNNATPPGLTLNNGGNIGLANGDPNQMTLVNRMLFTIPPMGRVASTTPNVESASGTTLTSATGTIYDASLNAFTLGASSLGGLGVYLNGTIQQFTANVILGLYFAHEFYQQNSAQAWYVWRGGTYVNSSDPRISTVPPSTAAGSLTVNLASQTGQTVYGTMYGIGTGALGDNGFARTGDVNIAAAFKQVAPTVFRVNINANVNGAFWQDAVFANGVASPQWQYFDPLFDNWSKWAAPNTQILLGVGPVNNAAAASLVASYATALANRAKVKGREIFLWEVGNEPNGKNDGAVYNGWFNAVADALHAINPAYKVFGPVWSFVPGAPAGGLTAWGNACGAKAGGCCMHTYSFAPPATVANHAALYANIDMQTQVSSIASSLAGTPAAGLPIVVGEWNIVSDVSNPPEQQGIAGAIYNALTMFRVMNLNVNVQYGANWEAYGDGTYGVCNDPNQKYFTDYRVFPAGYLLGYAGQHMNGNRVATTLNVTGNIVQYAVVNGNQWCVQIINYDTATAFNAFPVSVKAGTSVGANVTIHQLSPANLVPLVTTATYASLMSPGINMPAESVTHISGTFS